MQKLGLTEFRGVFYDNLDTIITTTQIHVRDCEEFYEEVIFKCFDLYQRDGSEFSVKDLLRIFHIFLYAMFKHEPSVVKNDDEILLN